MKVAIIGRTRMLLETAQLLLKNGHVISFVWSAVAEKYYDIKEDDFKQFAAQNNIPFYCTAKINDTDSISLIRDYGCEIAVSVNFPGIISEPVINLFAYGILNAHAGDLPRYRGNACINWAILNDEPEVGLSVHQMAPELDSGPVLLKKFYKLTETTYVTDVHKWMEQQIPPMFLAAIEGLEAKIIIPVPQPQDNKLVLRTYPRRPEDGRILWNNSAQSIMKVIRANSRPFEGAFTYLENMTQVIIWKADIFKPDFHFCAVAGQVCLKIGCDPVIACDNAMIRIIDATDENGASADEVKGKILSSLRNRLS